jgi:transglutaminase-like putative cysteine protease
MTAEAPSLAPRNLYLLFAGLVLAVAPHTERLPWWVNAWITAAFAWRIFIAARSRRLPHRAWLIVLALAGTAGVFLSFRTIFGRDAGVTLLVLLMSLKLLEIRLMRDIFVVVFLAYFLALTTFFYSQTMLIGLLMLVTVLLITASLVAFNDPEGRPRETMRAAAVLLAQATPVMVLLFFLFPRVNGPLWGLPQDAFAGVTGLSDSMSPGALSRLSLSEAIAFRVRFEGPLPARRQLYWRGPVFWSFDGTTWRVGNFGSAQQPVLAFSGAPVDYEVTLEPHNRNWLFALDMPARVPPNARTTHDYQLLSLPPVRARVRYGMRSYPVYQATAGALPHDLSSAQRLPPRGNPRARALAAEWRQSAGPGGARNADIVRRALEYFGGGRYQYTLEPPLLGADSVDEFLFDTRQGFCEHFSSAFAFLMRAAGVPARIVTGYQGGELNPIDGYMVVRQSDAHAWTEVWLDERGWVRVDPTATATPLRVDEGLARAVPQPDTLPFLIRTDQGWLRDLRFNWEALTNQWNQWVLGYNVDRQREMLSFFGVRSPDWGTLALLLLWSVAGVLGLTALWLFGRVRRRDRVQQAWLSFCAKLARAGLARQPGEGPLAYGQRTGEALPQRARAIADITGLYADLRYGRTRSEEDASRLRSLVKGFSA